MRRNEASPDFASGGGGLHNSGSLPQMKGDAGRPIAFAWSIEVGVPGFGCFTCGNYVGISFARDRRDD